VLKGKGEKTTISNFYQYGLENNLISIVRCDLALNKFWKFSYSLDAIVGDTYKFIK
jgi:hypothetical protein